MLKEIQNIITNLGVNTTSTPNTQLRNSWYVEKLMELGYNPNNVNHLELSCGGFIAQIDDNLFCSGANIYITDALSSMCYELGIDEFFVDDYCQIYTESDDNENDFLIIFSKEDFQEFVADYLMY